MHFPLHYAAELGHRDIARMLIESGICDVNSAYGKTSGDDKMPDKEWSGYTGKVYKVAVNT